MNFFFCREHTARVMETVRAINAGKSSKKSRKIGAQNYQSASTSKTGAGFNFSLAGMATKSRGGGEGAAHPQDGNPVSGTYRTVVNQKGLKSTLLPQLKTVFVKAVTFYFVNNEPGCDMFEIFNVIGSTKFVENIPIQNVKHKN